MIVSISSIEYVGIQTKIGKSSDFSEIKAAINEKLENNNRRSRRPLSVIFRALKVNHRMFDFKYRDKTLQDILSIK